MFLASAPLLFQEMVPCGLHTHYMQQLFKKSVYVHSVKKKEDGA